MNGQPMSRRELLTGLIALAGVIISPVDVRSRSAPSEAVTSLACRLGMDAAMVGKEYLRANRSEASVDILAERLLERLGDVNGPLATRLAEVVREDFERDQTVKLDGWLLSRTEARVCAIAHLFGESGTPLP